jgi:type VI secretion system secreted protein Hcp
MPIPAYMTIELKDQGEISEGCCSEDSIGTMAIEAQEDAIQVQAYKQLVHLPTVPAYGKASGPRIHKGIVITKVFDKCSPLLYQAMCKGEQIENLEITWFRINSAGEPEHYYTHTLSDAVITRMEAYMPDCQNEDNEPFTHMEDVWINYKAIEATHEIAGTTGADEWGGGE